MARAAGRDRAKERHWRRVLWRWQASGQPVRGYCRQHGLSEPSFYAWRRTIQQRNREALGRRLQPRRQPARQSRAPAAAPGGADLPAFVPMTIAPPPACLELSRQEPLDGSAPKSRRTTTPAPHLALALRQGLQRAAFQPGQLG
jgi:hypothetical protein